MRKAEVLIMACALALAGCAKSADQLASQTAADEQQCVTYGFAPGTDAYARCRMTLDQARQEKDAARRKALFDALAEMDKTPSSNSTECVSERQYPNKVVTRCHDDPLGQVSGQ